MTITQDDAATSSGGSPVEGPSDGATAFDQLIDKVRAEFDTQFTWDYERGRDGLNRLYEKAKRSQWNVSDDLDWSIDVDPERMVRLQAETTGIPAGFPARSLLDVKGSPVASWNDDQWVDFAVNSQCASLSQFLHGEQGALLCTARLVESVPWIEAKYYGSTQVVDEARHVEAFARYLDEKMPTSYPINENLKSLLDSVLSDERWDLVYLGMQVVIEGLALAAFGMMLGTTQEPLLKNLLRYVMSDEARHVAF
ncbi:MAG TPA: ferritin-like domain-containing protein, partial [Acidimicrobiales bacterium]|nr:ferritin-like domain-containing protein [Acidimicrobiales bacterium]